jgi:hypothetical protein
MSEEMRIGQPVRYWKGAREGKGKLSRTRTEVQDFHGRDVVWVEGEGGFISMTHIKPVEAYPCGIGVFCDNCGTEEVHDYLVVDDMDQQERFEVARRHLEKNENWRCTEAGDYCPVCKLVTA